MLLPFDSEKYFRMNCVRNETAVQDAMKIEDYFV